MKSANPVIISLVFFVLTTLVFASLGIYFYSNKSKLEKKNSNQIQDLSTLKQQLLETDLSLKNLTLEHANLFKKHSSLEVDIIDKAREISDLKSLIKTQADAVVVKPDPEQPDYSPSDQKAPLKLRKTAYTDLKKFTEYPDLDPKVLFELIYQACYSRKSALETIFSEVKKVDPDIFPSFDFGFYLFELHMERLYIEGIVTDSEVCTSNVHLRMNENFVPILKKHLGLGMFRIPRQPDADVIAIYKKIISILAILDNKYVPPALDEAKIDSYPPLVLIHHVNMGTNTLLYPLKFRFSLAGEYNILYQRMPGRPFFINAESFYSQMHKLCTGSEFDAAVLEEAIKNIVSSQEGDYVPFFISFMGLKSFMGIENIKYVGTEQIWIDLKKRYLADLVKNHFALTTRLAKKEF
jgi:hypothetical protein